MDWGDAAFAVLHFRDVAGDGAASGGEIFLAEGESSIISESVSAKGLRRGMEWSPLRFPVRASRLLPVGRYLKQGG